MKLSVGGLVLGPVAAGLPPVNVPPLQTTIGNETLYFTDMIQHIGTTTIALPLVAILESIAIAKAFCKFQCHFYAFTIFV